MNAVPFDTLKLARDLQAAGLAPPVAAGASAALADAMTSTDFATRSDLAQTESRVTGEIKAAVTQSELRFAALEAKLELLRRDMTIKLGGMMIIAVGVLLTAMRFMPHP